ncbi:ABC transporter permease [Bacillus xiapuensis]|uniref:ABC transporter permease n=1 Tax=Bacillus xiapuensis TaxID=2014075 RepID=UPI000C23E496|nr:ABC transporter permease [Bacillus xiapuensis]
MKSLAIAWKDVKASLLDGKALLLMFGMPLLLTAILGTALKGVMGGEQAALPVTVGIYQEDGDSLEKDWVTAFKKIEGVSVTELNSKQAVKQKLEEGSIDAGLLVPAQWSQGFQSGDWPAVTVITDPEKDHQLTLIEAAAESIAGRTAAISQVTRELMKGLSSSQQELLQKDTAERISQELAEAAAAEASYVKEQPLTGEKVSALQYYAAAMAVMFLLFNAMKGAKSFLHEHEAQTLMRLMSTPTSKGTILAGKCLGTWLYALLQFIVFMLATGLIFGVDWGDNPFQSLAVSASYAAAVSGLSIALASLVDDEKTADTAGTVSVQILSLLGGSMVPMMLFPEFLQKLAYAAPNTWALTSFTAIMRGESWEALIQPIIVMLAFGLVSIVIGAWRMHKRRRRSA